MDLILWRHAEAEDGAPDLQRALTAKGQRQAQKMAGWLERHLPGNLRIVCSPARRALQTVEALELPYKVLADLAPEATPETILAAINWPNARRPVLLIGHQPTLGQLAALLVGGAAQDWTIRKGNVWWISQQDKETGAGYFIRAVMAPELVGK